MSDLATDRVHVALSDRSYDILVGSGLLNSAAQEMRDVISNMNHVVCIADESVVDKYAAPIQAAMESLLIRCNLVCVPSGETSKSPDQLTRIWSELLKAKTDRGSIVLAVGGGVIGDLAGFAAASFARGVRLVQFPTTLLSQVDSSVGGKTGINLPLAKNLVGAFWQPSLVLIDTKTLETLPRREYVSGLAEVVKYGIILDEELFEYLEENVKSLLARDHSVLRKIIVRSCQLKAEVVSEDERETTGRRAILNYGHTFAHALEAGTAYGRLLHGEAVSIGMHMAAQLALHIGMVTTTFVERQRQLLEKLQLPTACDDVGRNRLWELMQHDKKVQNGRLNFILPRRIGMVECVSEIESENVLTVLTAIGLAE